MRPESPTLLRLSLLALLMACTPTSVGEEGGDTDHSQDEEDSGPETSWSVDELDDQELDDDWLFNPSFIHEIEIGLSSEAKAALRSDPYEYTEGSVIIDGVEVESVGLRLRGKIGSFRELSGKPKWKVDFNRYVDGQRFYGLESLSLNNAIVDCSYLKEVMAAQVYGALEVPGSRASFAHVTVNDEDYGLYIVIETEDDRFLKRNYEYPDGNLYDAKYWYNEASGEYQLLDFGWGLDEAYQLEEGTDVGHADLKAVSAAYLASAGTADYYATMGEVVDWRALHASWAAEQWLGQNDGYVLNRNNTRLYFDPEDGKAEQILWDFDYSFLQDSDWGRSWRNPTGNLAAYCRADAACEADWQQAVSDMLDVVDALPLQDRFDEYKDLTEDAIDDDDKRECPSSSVRYYQNAVDDWLDERSDEVRRNWGL